MGQPFSYVTSTVAMPTYSLHTGLDYRIEAFSFDASPVDFRARPLAKILMSSDLPLPIKRPNSSAVKGMFSSRTLGRPAPKNSLNQRLNRRIEDHLRTKPPTDFHRKRSNAKLPLSGAPLLD
jgi:hypothetical protein